MTRRHRTPPHATNAVAGAAADGPLPAPRVSVVIPAYNAGAFIEEAVVSILIQGIVDLEIIVVDDSSTDDTQACLARITDPRLRVARVPKSGVGAARNHGIGLARGTYLAFLDADDRWRPGKLTRQLALLESEPEIGFVFTNFRRFDADGPHPQTQFDLTPQLATVPTRPSRAGDGRIILGDAFEALVELTQLACWTQTLVVRRECVREIAFPTDMRLGEDLHYVLNLYRVARGAYIETPLVDVRRHSANSYRRASEMILPDIEALTRVLDSMELRSRRVALRRRLARTWLAAGYNRFRAGDARGAMRAYFRAMLLPGARIRALVRLLASPAAPVLARRRSVNPAFPSGRQ